MSLPQVNISLVRSLKSRSEGAALIFGNNKYPERRRGATIFVF